MDMVRIGMVGTGGIAQAHLDRLLKREDTSVVALCDTEVARAEATQKRVPGARVYASYKEMLDTEGLDAIYVCIPPFAHTGQVEYAAEKGVAVFVEKPIAINSVRALSMVEAVEKNKVVSQVGYHMRFGGAIQKLKGMIEDGSAGKCTLFDGRYSCNSLHSPWWREKEKSGGQIFEQVIHTYDQAMYLFGKPNFVIGTLSNLCHREVERYTAEDTSSSIIKFQSGAIASISASNCAIPGKWVSSFTVICEKVVATFSDENHAEFVYTDKEPVRVENVALEVDCFAEETDAFLQAVQGNGKQIVPLREGLRSLLLVEKSTLSSENGSQMQRYEEPQLV